MLDRMLIGIKKFAEAWKAVLITSAAVGFVGTSAIFVDHWLSKKTTESIKVDKGYNYSISDSVKSRDFQEKVFAGFRRSDSQQMVIINDIKQFTTEQGIMKKIMIDQFAKTMTKNDWERMVKDLYQVDSKKNDNNLYPTVLR